MPFKDIVARNNKKVWMDTQKLAKEFDIVYDDVEYTKVLAVLSKDKQKQTLRRYAEETQGLFRSLAVFSVVQTESFDIVPEPETRIKIGVTGAWKTRYRIVESSCKFGKVRLELEVLDE